MQLIRSRWGAKSGSKLGRPARPRARLVLESLEARWLLSRAALAAVPLPAVQQPAAELEVQTLRLAATRPSPARTTIRPEAAEPVLALWSPLEVNPGSVPPGCIARVAAGPDAAANPVVCQALFQRLAEIPLAFEPDNAVAPVVRGAVNLPGPESYEVDVRSRAFRSDPYAEDVSRALATVSAAPLGFGNVDPSSGDFANAPDVKLTAHELAHSVQQRGARTAWIDSVREGDLYHELARSVQQVAARPVRIDTGWVGDGHDACDNCP